MSDTVTFKPNTTPNPVFVGRGSKIEHPDVLPIFWGPYWPGTGDVTVLSIMNQLYAMVNGPYFDGLKQYGYVGPVQVRVAMIDRPPTVIPVLPPPGPGIDQIQAIDHGVDGYIDWLVRNDKIDNVDDNHELIILIFLDPNIPVPTNTNSAGVPSGATGDNHIFERGESLDDNTRFERAWINTSRDLASIMGTVAHELVEAITDPFSTGWHQTSPPAGTNAGQIGDVCNQSGTSGGASVTAYWSMADNACIIPVSGTRRISLSYTRDKPVPTDGPTRKGWVDFPIICGGPRYFDYVERTYRNSLKIRGTVQGYESPVVTYTINGQAVPLGLSTTIDVDAVWDEPRSNPIFPDLELKPQKARLATWKPSPVSPDLDITVGPNAGNTNLHIEMTVMESFDNSNVGANGVSKKTAFLDIDVKNQEIVWGAGHDSAVKNCNRMMHLSDSLPPLVGVPKPGDPPDLAEIIARALRDQSSKRADALTHAAQLVKSSRPEIAEALGALAQRANGHGGL